MSDLFSDARIGEQLPVEGASLLLFRSYLSEEESNIFFEEILRATPWEQQSVTVWGKNHLQPRLVCWMGDKSYSYSGLKLSPLPFSKTIITLKNKIERTANAYFNSVLLNLYRSGLDRLGAHSDDEPELGASPTIASLSLGATRSMRFSPRDSDHKKPFTLRLSSGDLLIMSENTQNNWRHEVPKAPKEVGSRVNLTFRMISS